MMYSDYIMDLKAKVALLAMLDRLGVIDRDAIDEFGVNFKVYVAIYKINPSFLENYMDEFNLF